MINQNFVYLGVAITALGGLSYLINTLRGTVQPNRVTWFLWSLAPLIAFAAEVRQSVGLQAWFTFILGFEPLLVVIASFINKKAYWKMTRTDKMFGALSLIG